MGNDPLTGNNALGYLHVDQPRALKRVGRLLNIGMLAGDLAAANSAINDFKLPTELNRGIYFDFPGISVTPAECLSLPDMGDVTLASYTCAQVANAFLSFIGQLWGTDETGAGALAVLWDMYENKPGYSFEEFLDDAQVALAGIGMALLAVGTAGIAVPAQLTWGVFILGLGASGYDIWTDYQAGTISEETFNRRMSLLVAMSILEGAGIQLQSMAAMRLAEGTVTNPRIYELMDSVLLSINTGLGASGDFDSTLETLYDALIEEGFTPQEARGITDGLADYANNPALNIPMPEGALTHPVPTFEGTAGPMQLPIDVTNPYEAGPDGNGTHIGDYSNDEIDDVLAQYPDFEAWWNMRAGEYYLEGHSTFFEDAVLQDGIKEVIEESSGIKIPPQYMDLIWLKLLRSAQS